MKKTIWLVAVFMSIVLASTADCAAKKKNYTIEPNAQIFGGLAGRMDIVNALVKFVKANGYSCGSSAESVGRFQTMGV